MESASQHGALALDRTSPHRRRGGRALHIRTGEGVGPRHVPWIPAETGNHRRVRYPGTAASLGIGEGCLQVMLSENSGGESVPAFSGPDRSEKGVDLLIGSYASVHGSDAGCPPHLVIAGPLDSEYAREMIGYASSLLPGGVHLRDSASSSGSAKGPGIHFTGMIQGEAKWGALHGCEALILPSHQENFGIAVVEALGCGRPVLISDKVNIHDVVTYAGAGLVSTDDLGGVRELLDGWMNLSPGCRAVMSEAAERIFISQYGAPEAAARFVSTLSPLIRP